MPKNTGTLVTAAIRPNASEDLIASAFAYEIMGGHHQYTTLSLRNSIIEERREWGMLCTVYNDGDNNGTYQLVYDASDTDINNNNNWVPFSGGGPVSSGEWLSSVTRVIDTPPITTPSDGTRYLIGTPSFGTFLTQSNKIATWSDSANGGLGGWVYLVPQTGYSLRSDDDLNVIYKYQGTWSLNNSWKKEYLTQIRYINPTSNGGVTYSFTSSNNMTPLDAYSYSVYYANFGTANTGPSVLQIDGLGYYSIKKVSGGVLTDLNSQDIIPNLNYNLSWNQTNFLLHGIGGAVGGSSGVIGPAEDGSYSDGLYTDFTFSTPVGTAIDRFNEILKALVPPQAPDLSSWTLDAPSFVTDGKLSFDGTIPTYVAAPGVAINGDYTPTTYRKGIMSGVSQLPNVPGDIYYQDITGRLNSGVLATTAYDQYAFGNGTTGSLVLKLNGFTISNVDLSNPAAVDQTISNGSGFTLTAATNSKFASGIAFDLFWWRSGTYTIRKNNANLENGYNYLEVSHVLPSTTLSLPSYTWVRDPVNTQTSFTETITSIATDANNGVKVLSGIKFYNSVTVGYQVVYNNHANSTYKSGNSLSAQTTDVSQSVSNPITNTVTLVGNTKILSPSSTLSPSPTTIPNVASPTSQLTKVWTFVLNNNVRRLNESVTFRTSVVRTVQGTGTSGGKTEDNWFIDNYTADPPSDIVESFEVETYRILNGSAKYSTGVTDTVSEITGSGNSFVSTTSLLTGVYRNQLQFINGSLIFPRYPYSNVGNLAKNPNFGNPNADYSQATTSGQGHGTYSASPLTNNRTFTRRFRLSSTDTFAKVQFIFSGSNFGFQNVNTTLGGQNLWVEVKLPTDPSRGTPPGGLINGAVTGWMDITKPFDPSPPSGTSWDNGAGAYTGSPTTTNFIVDFGKRNTFYSGGYVLLRITAPSTWSGNINEIRIFGVTIP
jgi:hypothetical protein